MLGFKKRQSFLLVLLLVIASYNQYSFAKVTPVTVNDDLQKVLNASQNGDVITLSAGKYLGNFIIAKQITLRGENGTVIDAQGHGHGLVLKNSYITIDSLNIINWGADLDEENSGIYVNNQRVNERAVGLVIKNNSLSGDGFGIWLNHATKATILNNKVNGNLSLPSAKRGNGIQATNVTNSHIADNDVFDVRDGIYVIASQHNLIEKNTVHQLRYGIHYMNSNDNVVKDNTAYNTRAGYALMSSSRLTVTGNKVTNSEDYGFLLNFLDESTLSDNYIKNVWTKPENVMAGRAGKGFFVYNSSANVLENNTVDTTEIGIHLTAGSENIQVYGNNFINNPTPVKYVSNTEQEWSKDGRGNYWSSYLGWDIDKDGIGDTIFEPNDGIDKLVWQYPEMKMIMDSPAIVILRWVQQQFPVLKSPGVTDSYPLMIPHFSQKKQNDNSLLVNQLTPRTVQ